MNAKPILNTITFFSAGFIHICQLGFAQPYAVGEAYSIDGETPLYTEKYYQLAEKKWKVDYLDTNGKRFAEKTVDFSKSGVHPGFEMENHWSQEHSTVTVELLDPLQDTIPDNTHNLIVRFGDIQTSIEDLKKEVIDAKNVVVDAGFDNFIRQSWVRLNKGKSVTFKFLVPSRFSTLPMKMKQVECDTKLTQNLFDYTEARDGPLVCMRTIPTNVLVRLVVPAIHLVYQSADKKLLRFNGLGNIADRDQKMLEVDIRYRYME